MKDRLKEALELFQEYVDSESLTEQDRQSFIELAELCDYNIEDFIPEKTVSGLTIELEDFNVPYGDNADDILIESVTLLIDGVSYDVTDSAELGSYTFE